MRAKLTPAFIDKASPPVAGAEVVYWDAALPGFGLAVTRNGHKSYVVSYRTGGRKRRMHLKAGLTLTDARREAKAILGAVAKGGDPLAERRKAERATSETLKALCEDYLAREGGMTRNADGKATFSGKLRSAPQRLAVFERLIYRDKIASRHVGEIKRSEINRLLDKIEDERGPRMAHVTLAYLSRVFKWHASRDDDFRSPIVRGMGRVKPRERAGKRILSDDELRAVWRAAEASPNVFSCLVQFLLLTATRRTEAAAMRRGEVSGDEWTIPQARYKTGLELVIPLSPAAQAVLAKAPKVGKAGLIFTTDGEHPIAGFSKFKRAFDAKVLTELRKQDPEAQPPPNWTLHDLRRTARSLMSRAGVPSDHAERCLGHVIGGVRGVYDKYEYLPEKRRAFEALAALIERIVNPPAGNVVQGDFGRAKAANANEVPA